MLLGGAGVLAIAVVLAASWWASVTGDRVTAETGAYTWRVERIYVNPVQEGTTRCTVRRADGGVEWFALSKVAKQVVPGGEFVAGRSEPSELRCDRPAQVSTGWMLSLYPVAEAGLLVAIPAVLAVGAGWVLRNGRQGVK